MLKKVQMPIAFSLRIVHRVLAHRLRVTEATARVRIHKNRQHPTRRVKARLNHILRRTHTRRRLKKLFRLHRPIPFFSLLNSDRIITLPTQILKEAENCTPL